MIQRPTLYVDVLRVHICADFNNKCKAFAVNMWFIFNLEKTSFTSNDTELKFYDYHALRRKKGYFFKLYGTG
jgi:hypothetical protein